jgi:hypothetical protein
LKKLLLFLPVIFTYSIAVAQTEAPPPVMVGGKISKGDNSLLIGDFSSFDLTKKDGFGLERYGFGRGQLEIDGKNFLNIDASAHNGIFLGSGDGAKIGLEVASGEVSYDSRPHLEYDPAISLGIREKIGDGAVFVAGRAGGMVDLLGTSSFKGVVASVQFGKVCASYWENDYYYANRMLRIYDVNWNNKFNFQNKTDAGVQTWMIGYRIK